MFAAETVDSYMNDKNERNDEHFGDGFQILSLFFLQTREIPVKKGTPRHYWRLYLRARALGPTVGVPGDRTLAL